MRTKRAQKSPDELYPAIQSWLQFNRRNTMSNWDVLTVFGFLDSLAFFFCCFSILRRFWEACFIVILRSQVSWLADGAVKGSSIGGSRWKGLLIKGGAVDASASCCCNKYCEWILLISGKSLRLKSSLELLLFIDSAVSILGFSLFEIRSVSRCSLVSSLLSSLSGSLSEIIICS
jgi:hypothetical protein